MEEDRPHTPASEADTGQGKVTESRCAVAFNCSRAGGGSCGVDMRSATGRLLQERDLDDHRRTGRS